MTGLTREQMLESVNRDLKEKLKAIGILDKFVSNRLAVIQEWGVNDPKKTEESVALDAYQEAELIREIILK